MKTIEERAEKARLLYFGYLPKDIGVTYKDGYVQGATEQKAIDIDKAVDWLANPSNEYFPMIKKGWQEAFRKAMEEQV